MLEENQDHDTESNLQTVSGYYETLKIMLESLEKDVPLDIGYVSIQPKYKVYCGDPIFYQSGYNYRATNFILD